MSTTTTLYGEAQASAARSLVGGDTLGDTRNALLTQCLIAVANKAGGGGGGSNSLLLVGATAGTLASLTAATAATGGLFYGTQAGEDRTFTFTAAGAAMAEAASVAAQRVLLNAATLGANTFTALQTITQAAANAGILASTGYSLTGSNATGMIDLAGTWNTTGTPTAIKLNITDTASNAASLFVALQVSSVSKFEVDKLGRIKGAYNPGFPQFTAVGLETSGMRVYSDRIDFWQAGNISLTVIGGTADIGTNGIFAFGQTRLTSGVTGTLQLGVLHATVGTTQALGSHSVTTGTGAKLQLFTGTGSVAGGTLELATPLTTGARVVGLSVGPGGSLGFYTTAPIARQTGVAVTAGGIHAALVALGIFTA